MGAEIRSESAREAAERAIPDIPPAPAIPANFKFTKAYFELKKLREDVECIERLSRSRSSQATEAAIDKHDPDHS
ncbi:hypothetical protein LMTR13_10200 [Bradyrhizobium icense]|uniref:Uncharacterized protein n=1 Tax=Bradyrhizobium icense TaxID=1274631 RepID=A0A1B1UCI6_9BRAD|nr:hypothetical protein LMTR13_10200 [Bradyrhizobium icense]